MKKLFFLFLICMVSLFANAQHDISWERKFEQLGTELPTPNTYRTASGAPGKDYWQQRADYDIKVTLDDNSQSITGEETITYYNQSPDDLKYLWLQLDQNVRARDSDSPLIKATLMKDTMGTIEMRAYNNDFDGGFKITDVSDIKGKPLKKVINKTMMRVDLPQPLKPREKFSFNVAWFYNVNHREIDNGRSGLEYFPKDDNYLYTIAQFFPTHGGVR